MRLEKALYDNDTCEKFAEIFEGTVSVVIDTVYGCDSVHVEGYEGTVSTDTIASIVVDHFNDIEYTQGKAALKLAEILKSKVFIPLRDQLVRLDATSYMSTLLYKIRNCTRIGWMSDDPQLTCDYSVLRHSMCIAFLDKSF